MKRSGKREEHVNAESRRTVITSDKLSGSRGSQLRQSWMQESRMPPAQKAPGIYTFTKKIDLREPIECWSELEHQRSTC